MARGQIYSQHIVSGAEAAYTTLLGHYTRRYGDGEWLSGLSDRRDPWPICLKQVYVEVLRGGIPAHGIPIGLYHIPAINSLAILDYAYQGWTQRAAWQGVQETKYGFGVLFRLGALAANDIVLVAATYD